MLTAYKDDVDAFLFINRLNIFCKQFKKLNAASAVKIRKYFLDMLVPMQIWVSMENIDKLSEIDNIKEKIKAGDAILDSAETIKARLRVILSIAHRSADFKIPLVRQANGLIIEVIQGTDCVYANAKVVPVNDLVNNMSIIDVEHFLRDGMYSIYPVHDGTTVNLYYDSNQVWRDLEAEKPVYKIGRWVYSTRKLYDIRNISWRGSKYWTVINDVLQGYPNFSFEALDKNVVYSFGFKHPAFHPFRQPQEWSDASCKWIKRMWHIRSVNMTTGDLLTSDEITKLGIPEQTPLNIQIAKDGCLYKALVAKCDAAYESYTRKGEVFFGYILRSRNELETQSHSDILLESTLFKEIKKCVYNKRRSEKSEPKNIKHIIVYSWLDFRRRDTFYNLFPQFAKYKSLIDETIKKTAMLIVNNMKEIPSLLKETPESCAQVLCRKLLPYIRKKYNLSSAYYYKKNWLQNSGADIDLKVVYDLIINPQYASLYASTIFPS